jgi:hypothetical protein
MSTPLRTTPTIQAFKQWANDCAPAARAVLMARVFADMERERVDAYILPIFQSYRFTVAKAWRSGPEKDSIITRPKDLYLSDDEVLTAAYFDECDQAHRAHGFTGPKGHCPALIAEHLVIVAENALIDLAKPLFGIEDVYGENRQKYLELLIGACMKAESEKAA